MVHRQPKCPAILFRNIGRFPCERTVCIHRDQRYGNWLSRFVFKEGMDRSTLGIQLAETEPFGHIAFAFGQNPGWFLAAVAKCASRRSAGPRILVIQPGKKSFFPGIFDCVAHGFPPFFFQIRRYKIGPGVKKCLKHMFINHFINLAGKLPLFQFSVPKPQRGR